MMTEIIKEIRIVSFLLYFMATALLFIGLMLPINSEISLDALLSNINKLIILAIALEISLLANRLSKFFQSDNSKISDIKLIINLITIAAMVIVLIYLLPNIEDDITRFIYFLEIIVVGTFIMASLAILDLVTYKDG